MTLMEIIQCHKDTSVGEFTAFCRNMARGGEDEETEAMVNTACRCLFNKVLRDKYPDVHLWRAVNTVPAYKQRAIVALKKEAAAVTPQVVMEIMDQLHQKWCQIHGRKKAFEELGAERAAWYELYLMPVLAAAGIWFDRETLTDAYETYAIKKGEKNDA